MQCLQECTRYKTDKDICLCVLAYIYLCQRDIAGGWSHHTRGLSVNNRRAVTSSNPGSCQIQSWLPTNTEPFTKSCYSATEGEETLRSVPAICNQVTQAVGTGRSMYTQVGYDKSRGLLPRKRTEQQCVLERRQQEQNKQSELALCPPSDLEMKLCARL
ncbi:uncharacterized protein LOC119885888 [Micropterus salmoides]|uniref:uncharacterized protein LOC119885888 n=1 Tax=Micropterus salmoides TaxID=27706 RepID=UPI0018EC44F1|nr:uncharacterized protein LOC119885888 [Micropterus salmoides]